MATRDPYLRDLQARASVEARYREGGVSSGLARDLLAARIRVSIARTIGSKAIGLHPHHIHQIIAALPIEDGP